MKVLFAVNNDDISNAIIKKYQKEYKEILSYKNVYYFNAILKELQKDKTYDRVVISEDLEPFTNNNYDAIDKFLFDKLDNISDEAINEKGNDTDIILICTDRRTKSDEMLIKLFGIGIYNAIVGQDRSINEVCKLINKPRTKKDAKIYYRIETEKVNYQSENENNVSETEVQNILTHYRRLGKDENKYVESFNNIVSQYNDNQLKIIIRYLPIGVKAVLEEKSPKYQELIDYKGGADKKSISVKNEKLNTKSESPFVISMLDNESEKPNMRKPIVIPSGVNKTQVKKLITHEKSSDVEDDGEIEIENTLEDLTKKLTQEVDNKETEDVETEELVEQVEKPKRGRGRPKKIVTESVQKVEMPKRGRGRPKKNAVIDEENNNSNEEDKIDLFNLDNNEEKNDKVDLHNLDNNDEEENEEVDLFNLDDNDEEENEEVDLFNLDDNDEEENEEADLFNLDDNDEEENEEVDLFNLDDNDEEENEEVDLFNLDKNDEEENDEVDLFNLDENDEEENNEVDLFSLNNNEDDEKSNQSKINVNDEYESDEVHLFNLENNNNNFRSGDKFNNKNEILETKFKPESSSFSSLITKDKKIVSFVGTTKNGTSFIVNNVAHLLASRGIKTAVLDMTKTRNAYYIYTNSEERLMEKARKCIYNLKSGIADGIEINKNLSIYTSVPEDDSDYSRVDEILETLIKNYSVVLIDCDFDTPMEYFGASQETYLVQSMDVLTMQPLTAFLRNLQSKGILKQEKLKIIINKSVKIRSVSIKKLIGGISKYNDPSMTYMKDLFDKDNINYCVIPFELPNYIKYLDSVITCSITLSGYTKQFMSALNELANMIYPVISKQTYSPRGDKYKDNFSNEMNDTLNKMKRQYK